VGERATRMVNLGKRLEKRSWAKNVLKGIYDSCSKYAQGKNRGHWGDKKKLGGGTGNVGTTFKFPGKKPLDKK